MNVQDAFRAQYFLAAIEKEIDKVQTLLPYFKIPLENLLKDFVSSLLTEVDQLLLPVIAFEIDIARQHGFLTGNSPQEKYISFFIQNNQYTEYAKSIITKYPFLFELIDSLISQTFNALTLSLERFWKDKNELREWLRLPSDPFISKIHPLTGSDRHRQQQAILITFSNNSKVIYKPVDLNPDILFAEFIKDLDFEEPYNLKALSVLPKGEYGWMGYIHSQPCSDLSEIQNFYLRQGVLLAVADALNYTDGHYENLIADGAFPILIDGETFFQNYEKPVVEQKNILSTMLIQKSDKSDQNFFCSALQAPSGLKYENLQTHAINDYTDEIEIRYRSINPFSSHHCPIFSEKPSNASDYTSFIIQGYCYGYDRITQKTPDILNNAKWWTQVSHVQSRTVLRETLSYVYLLRKIQQPEMARDKNDAISFLKTKLNLTPYTEYEIADLLTLNIPYFYHFPGQKHLYNGKGQKYTDVFTETAINSLKKQFLDRSEEQKNFNCEIIARHLIPSESKYELVKS